MPEMPPAALPRETLRATLNGSAALYAVTAMLVILGWQWTTVAVNYGGNWTALFRTGALRGVPPPLANERVYEFAGSNGFDGQLYHYVAHDPLMRDPQLTRFVDDPRLRYRRILVPAAAWLAALGQSRWIDSAYIGVCLFAAGLGVYWSCTLCNRLGYATAWGLLFLLLPSTVIGIDRMAPDILLGALTAGFVVHSRRFSAGLWLILAAAFLTRETGALLAVGFAAHHFLLGRWRVAVAAASACVPAALWFAWVNANTAPSSYGASFVPFSAILPALFHPAPYPAGVPLEPALHAGDTLALCGVLAAFGLAFALSIRRCLEGECIVSLCFAVMGVVLQRPDHWLSVYDFGRVYSPLLVCLAVYGLRSRTPVWFLAPWLLMLPRIGMQLAPQILKIAVWLGQPLTHAN